MTQLTITRPAPSFWRVTFDNPPVNLIDSQTIIELRALIDAAETDPELTVILFESANPDYFLAHWDLTDNFSPLASQPPAVTGQQPFVDVVVRISKLPVLTISALRPRLVGRGRALEILMGAEDFDGDLAERYGYVNRAVPDAEPDDFVTAFATRVAGFERSAVRQMKGWVNQITLPEDTEFPPQSDAFLASLQERPFQGWARRAFEQGLQQPGDLEEQLGTRAAKL